MSKHNYKKQKPDRNQKRWQEKQRKGYLQSLWRERAFDTLLQDHHELLQNFGHHLSHPLLEFSDFVLPPPREKPEIIIPLTIERPEHELNILQLSLVHGKDIGVHIIASPDQSSATIEQALKKFVMTNEDIKKLLIIDTPRQKHPHL